MGESTSVLYERLGRLQHTLDLEVQKHLTTINLLGRVVRGDIDPGLIEVTEDGWTIHTEQATRLIPLNGTGDDE